ncbi:MAG TPA: hypothetical protein VL382_10845, partial [Terriglobales bacterium]|nr:hypothetical protein [Terriglobales bacterium]
MLQQSQLFERLAQGHAARITVVTPNRRLAHRLTLDFDDYQIARGLTSWEAADILPFGSWVERLWEDALYSDLGDSLPLLLTPAQEQHLWEGILAKSGLLIVPQAAAQCRDAWRLIHQWRVGTGQGNEDAAAFSQWASTYRKQTAGEIDSARLPDLMMGLLPKIKTPALVVAYSFDAMPPQTKEFLGRFTTEECAADPVAGSLARAPYPSAKHELEAAARWARARLEEGKKRIGVVVPDLGKRRQEVSRVFTRVMHVVPAHFPSGAGTPLPFNISIGRPLASYPLVNAALGLLELSHQTVEFSLASHLIRSAFIGGGDTEMSRRAALDVRIRRDADATISLAKLIAAATEPAPLLRKHLEAVFALPRNANSPAEWARHFSA